MEKMRGKLRSLETLILKYHLVSDLGYCWTYRLKPVDQKSSNLTRQNLPPIHISKPPAVDGSHSAAAD